MSPVGTETASARPPLATGSAVRVAYIAGCGRSGTTLIERIIGQLPGVFAAGEIRFLWQRGLIENRLCGCGVPFDSCPTWSAITGPLLRPRPDFDPGSYARLQRRRVRALRLPLALLPRRVRALGQHNRPDSVLVGLYEGIAAHASGGLIVDSSKLPSYALLLEDVPGVQMQILHVVRDPRGTAFSWSRRRSLPKQDGGRPMQRQGPVKSALLWMLWNCVTEAVWAGKPGRYRRLRYEDFADNPEAASRGLADFLSLDAAQLPFLAHDEACLEATHTVAGNPGRHSRGRVVIKTDAEWLVAMSTRDVFVVTLLTWPMLLRYGYPLFPKRASS